MTNAPAGWYPDGSGRQRYWDGASWTEHFAATPPAPADDTDVAPPAGPARRPPRTGLWVGLGAAAVILIGLGVTLGVVLAPVSLVTYLKGTWNCSAGSMLMPVEWRFDGSTLEVGPGQDTERLTYPVVVDGSRFMVNDYVISLQGSTNDGVHAMRVEYGGGSSTILRVTKSGSSFVIGDEGQEVRCVKLR